MSEAALRPGLDRERIKEILGEPDRIVYIQVSFRPPNALEEAESYRRASSEWARETVGELWRYENRHLLLKLSKAGSLMLWEEIDP